MCWNGGMTKHSLHDRVPSQPIYIPIHYSHTLNLVEFPRINASVVNSLLHAEMPSFHVCSKLESPVFPHLSSQAPPSAQQLGLPVFLRVPHLLHVLEGIVVAAAAVVIADGFSVDV